MNILIIMSLASTLMTTSLAAQEVATAVTAEYKTVIQTGNQSSDMHSSIQLTTPTTPSTLELRPQSESSSVSSTDAVPEKLTSSPTEVVTVNPPDNGLMTRTEHHDPSIELMLKMLEEFIPPEPSDYYDDDYTEYTDELSYQYITVLGELIIEIQMLRETINKQLEMFYVCFTMPTGMTACSFMEELPEPPNY